mgnify:CR=1 FL=1
MKKFTPVYGKKNLVQILAYSENVVTGDKVLTVVFPSFPKLLQAELRTHRSARINETSNQSHYSSRAIPIEKALKQVEQDPFIFELTAFAKGMNGNELDKDTRDEAEKIILELRDFAVAKVRKLMVLGIAKQDCNRYIEPWMKGGCIVTFSQNALEHFLDLRTKPGVQPDMRNHALELQQMLTEVEPLILEPGEWHLPYLDNWVDTDKLDIEDILKISAARCARISYENFDGDFALEKDVALFDRLTKANPPHLTPLEHQAQALETSIQCWTLKGFASQRYLAEQ